jgi:hypothetical protein
MADLKVADSTANRARSFYQEAPPTLVTSQRPAFLMHTESPPAGFKGRIYSGWHQVNTIPVFQTISSTPVALEGVNYINLEIPQAFHVPLSPDFVAAQFYCSDASTFWDESDIAKLESKTASDAIAAGLSSKIVLIGDSTDTFEMFGARSLGPFAYRNSNRATQIVKDESIYRVTDMLLQLLEGGTGTNTLSIAYTKATTIVPKDRSLIIVADPGDINLPSNPMHGFLFTLDDRKNGLLAPGRNRVHVPLGQTMAVDQTAPNIDHTVPLDWENTDKRSFIDFFYDAPTSNWVVLISRQAGFSVVTGQTQIRTPILTGSTTTIAQPFDNITIGGNGDIDIHLLDLDLDYIDIAWSVGDAYTFKVLQPLGFTIGGDATDLEVNTLLTNRQKIRITLRGTDYGVGA